MEGLSLAERLARLSPEQRAVIEQRLLADAARRSAGAAPIQSRPTTATCPLSYGQERFWLHQQFYPGSFANNEHDAYRIVGRLDVESLQSAFDTVVARHGVLRTSVRSTPRGLVGEIRPPRAVELRIEDWGGDNHVDLSPELLRHLGAEIRRPFDLASDDLLRGVLVRLGPDDHVLLVVIHHSAMDGWSLVTLLQEISAVYQAGTTAPITLSEPGIDYADVAAWERDRVQSGALAEHLEYWQKTLAGVPAIDLPTDRSRPALPTFRGGRCLATIDPDLTTALRRLAEQGQTTLYVVLLAAFQVLLHRYTGQTDFAVGTPIAKRDRPELNRVVGYLVNLLALRCDLAGDPTFRAYLGQCREAALAAMAHSDLPYGLVVLTVPYERDVNRNPLFQVMFAFQNLPRRVLELGAATVTPIEVDPGLAKFDLSLYVHVGSSDATRGRPAGAAPPSDSGGPSELRLSLEFSQDLFDPSTAERLLENYITLLRGIADNPDRPLTRLPILARAERQKLLVTWNQTVVPFPVDRAIHQLIEEQAAKTPRALAVRDEQTALTYADLNLRANRVRDALEDLGLLPGAIVGVLVDRSVDALVVLLGVMKAGAVYLPLDPAEPTDRLAFVVQDARPFLIVARRKEAELARLSDARLVQLDEILQYESSPVAIVPDSRFDAGEAAYVMYASGSTGRPKGVVGTHRGAVNRFHWLERAFPFEPGEVCCQKTSLGFVDSVWELFGPMSAGVPIAILDDATVRDPVLLVAALARYDVTRVVLVPSLLRVLLDAFPDLAARLPRLRFWISSGEALSRELADRFRDAMPGRRLVNLYGSSEVAADVTCFDLTDLQQEHESVPIGRPIANTRVYVLDQHRQPVPIGVRGELYVGGTGVALGYLHRAELTAEKFVPDPFSDQPNALMFRTGDQVRFLPDGNLAYLGRFDHQVKIRGNRVELGEVEAVLNSLDGIREAVVVAREDGAESRRLDAFVVLNRPEQLTVGQIREQLRQRLPVAMRPTTIVLLDPLPLTASGKVDRVALLNDRGSTAASESTSEPILPRDAIERQLRTIWESLLSTRPISVADDFFAVGGHSLLAVQLVARIERVFGRRLPLATLAQSSSIEELAKLLRTAPAGDRDSVVVPIQSDGSRPPVFLVHGIGGAALVFRDLARHLGPDQPVYAIQSHPHQPDNQARTVEERAREYVHVIRQVRPTGPYYLGGYSAGGIWAFEMARQLRASGQDVAILVLLDTRCPWLPRHVRLWRNIRRAVAAGSSLRPDNARQAASRLGALIFRQGGRSPGDVADVPRPEDAMLRTIAEVSARNRLEIQAYRPSPYDGPVLLVRTGDREQLPYFVVDPYVGWNYLIRGRFDVKYVPGGHRAMLAEPYVGTVADAVAGELARVSLGT